MSKCNINSLLYWFPKIEKLGIPMPRTETLKIPFWDMVRFLDNGASKYEAKIKERASRIGYPLFLRTDQASGKHDWKNTCYVRDEDELIVHVCSIVDINLMLDLFCEALVFRELIEMDSRFTAFYGEMPVNPERRYFINNGTVLCHHPYWIEDAIEKGTSNRILPDGVLKKMLPDNWRELARAMNKETEEEIKLLTSYAEKVAQVLDGYWSVDFCKARDGRWILIDCGIGFISWHPECEQNLEVRDRVRNS